MNTKIKLPPKPSSLANAPVLAPVAVKIQPKAVKFRVDLEDGTYLLAQGDIAADIYAYLMDCERYCGSRMGTVMIYMGPGLEKFSQDGKKIG